jgi:hypothetical protein
LAQLRQRLAAEQRAQEKAVGLQSLTDLDQGAHEVIGPVQAEE